MPSGQPTSDAVGRPDQHKSASQQATGEAVYCDDMPKIDGKIHVLGLITRSLVSSSKITFVFTQLTHFNADRGRSWTQICESTCAEIRADLFQRESMWIRVIYFFTIYLGSTRTC